MGNLEAAQKLRQLADTQASLRRLAVLIASGAAPDTVFAGCAERSGCRYMSTAGCGE
jgi:hypothetical protein